MPKGVFLNDKFNSFLFRWTCCIWDVFLLDFGTSRSPWDRNGMAFVWLVSRAIHSAPVLHVQGSPIAISSLYHLGADHVGNAVHCRMSLELFWTRCPWRFAHTFLGFILPSESQFEPIKHLRNCFAYLKRSVDKFQFHILYTCHRVTTQLQ